MARRIIPKRKRIENYEELVARRLNDLRREARAKGYPCSVDDSLEPLTETEKATLASVSSW